MPNLAVETIIAPTSNRRHSLLVGSIPLASTTEVFRHLTTSLSRSILRVPDGETGIRGQYVLWQLDLLKDYQIHHGEEATTHEAPLGGHLEDLETGYEDYAIRSYMEFCRLREEGIIRKGIRFQVSLPTPLNVIACGVHAKYQVEVEPKYEAALLRALSRIQDAIPAKDLAVQWDVALEFAFLEMSAKGDLPYPEYGWVLKPWFAPVKSGILERLIRLTGEVRAGVQMGFHLCYGDLAHKHFVQPVDMSNMVDVANKLADASKREIDWIHMPVPKNRVDKAFYAPLKDLMLNPGTEVYLGLVHARDIEGTQKRIETASLFMESFGVSSECGLGRATLEEFKSVVEIMATVTKS
ncbi:hypothetical protein DL98DRAFT_657774 [Cadophora sp. DSE1049]|nr:hypothetical protein DL98DRAFT_657774 [Cadophora sp. DSE1049]